MASDPRPWAWEQAWQYLWSSAPAQRLYSFTRTRLDLQACLTLAGTLAATSGTVTKWPGGPFVTSGRWIHDAAGNNITYAGVNWPGAADTMLPEGLQYQSIESIVSRVKSVDMNAIRLTYSIQMVDEIYENGGADTSIKTSLITALGETNGTNVFDEIVKNNPGFGEETTRLEVFDAVAAECARQKIYVHLDNHISKAEWCCSTNDGNSWWGTLFRRRQLDQRHLIHGRLCESSLSAAIAFDPETAI